MEEVVIGKIVVAAATYAIDRPFDYLLPGEMASQARPGVRVMVPFGAGNRRSEGFLLSVGRGVRTAKLKTVLSLLDEAPVLDADGIQLALWMRDQYFCTVYEAARAMLPAGLWFSLRDSYRIAQGVDREASYQAAGRSAAARKVLDLIWPSDGEMDALQLRDAFGGQSPSAALKLLTECGVLKLETRASQGVGEKSEQVASLALDAEEAMALVSAKRKSAPLRYGVVELLCGVGCAAVKEICYFTGASSATVRALAKSGIVTLERRTVLRRVSVEGVEPEGPPVLNAEQENAFTELEGLSQRNEPAVALLYGVTGSGKTQVYIRLIREVLARGHTAMVLVPEIALTPQLLRIFTAHFGQAIAVLHSSLRAGERYDEWRRVRDGQARVVLGTRSAVFAPLKDLGLVILDEEQEGSYKSENTPRYHAREVAKYRCAKSRALLVLGSATPAVETMHLAKTGVYHLVTLRRRYNEQALPSVYISDMKGALREGNGGAVSGLLCRELTANLERGEQSILFLNRRGANRMVSCGECGQVPTCPRCSVHLTYHSANGRLMCHYCGHSEPLPRDCPACGGRLQFIGIGTQRVQEELEGLFPGTEVLRMDTDTVTATQSHETLLSRFEQKKIPILVGTQMVAKGLDFKNVTLVGVVAADLGLYVDSFRAAERTFSLLTQVVGRAGRGEKVGRAVIQTYTPDNEVIRFAAAQDYDSFYDQEIELRRLRLAPPFCDLFVLMVSGTEEAAVLRVCLRLRGSLDRWLGAQDTAQAMQLLGPAPAAVAKVNHRYRYRLTLCGKNTREIRGMLAHLLRAVAGDRENRGVSVRIDVNPYD